MSIGINLFFMVNRYNTSLLDYNIMTADTENRGARTPVKMGEKIIRKLREAFDFAQAVIVYTQDI